ncbi:VCBS repeat-containing protein [Maritimibacter sp. UBA3975]|uniref:FG-GAP repeat domain-containing protein n=1 Tax=Maritimibacter sp. UBA3975 TaxID=1946833 RepID=UPI000C0A9ADD|nr:VCBS repeat-containing protein [Maritimibacter sp. UBA3975]MAM62574.1 hypothetical protein [Maritimibacter sp.]|tara:strand:+ start:10927 stop:11643 length:717 start_codon:yes stop_codon:yes gene_type:complete
MLIRSTLAVLALAGAAQAKDVSGASYVEPTDAYGHGAVKNGEYAGLRIDYDDGSHNVIRFDGAVFEDTAPRLHDFDGDGTPEVVAVLSGFRVGAMVQIFDFDGEWARPIGNTQPIGQRHRWLAIAGIADFDGDGVDEVAYVDRPHLARILRLARVEMNGGKAVLTPVAAVEGVTNHLLGTPEIEGGVRHCAGTPPAILTANADWSRIVETIWDGAGLVSTEVGDYAGPESFAPYLECA